MRKEMELPDKFTADKAVEAIKAHGVGEKYFVSFSLHICCSEENVLRNIVLNKMYGTSVISSIFHLISKVKSL